MDNGLRPEALHSSDRTSLPGFLPARGLLSRHTLSKYPLSRSFSGTHNSYLISVWIRQSWEVEEVLPTPHTTQGHTCPHTDSSWQVGEGASSAGHCLTLKPSDPKMPQGLPLTLLEA